jgi:hypothetical protein
MLVLVVLVILRIFISDEVDRRDGEKQESL